MKKSKILSIILGIALVIVMVASLVACNDTCTEHVDENGDLKCDNCEANMPSPDEGNGGDGGTTTPSEKDTYTFTLKDQNNAGVPNVEVQVLVDGTAGEIKATDTNGSVSFAVKKDAVLVQVTILEWNDLYVNDLASETISFINTKNLVINDIVKRTEYVITVVDNLGSAVEGAQVQLCFGTVCKTPKMTSKTGKASILATEDASNAYVSINSLPNGYALQNGGIINDGSQENYTKYTNWEGSSIKIVVDKLNVVTITAGGLSEDNGERFKDIKIDIFTQNDILVASEITDENGKVEFILPVGNYSFSAVHKDNNPMYTWEYASDEKVNITSNKVFTSIVFHENLQYTFNVSRTNAEASLEGLTVKLLNRLYEEEYVDSSYSWAEAEVVDGVATITAPYDTHYVTVVGLESGYCPIFIIEKNGDLIHDIIIDDSLTAGSVNAPINLVYGYNGDYNMAMGDTKFFKLINPKSASLVAYGNVRIVVNSVEYTAVDGEVVAPLGNSEEVLVEINALEDLYYFGFNVNLEGSKDAPIKIAESSLTDGNIEVDVDLSLGARYYEFSSTSAATLTITSNDDVIFYIDDLKKNKSEIDVDGYALIKVVGEGNATINFNYAERFLKYEVRVSQENDLADGIIVNIVYNGDVVAEAVSVNGLAVFENLKAYPIYNIFATVEEENIPLGYVATEKYAIFTCEPYNNAETGMDEDVYNAAYVFELIRDGSQNAPYLWHKEGIYGMPTEIGVEISAGQTLHYEFFGQTQGVRPPEYFIYVMGNVNVKLYKDIDNDGEIDFDSFDIATFDATKNATWISAPNGYKAIIAVSSTEDATLTLKCKEGYVPDMSSGEEEAPAADGSQQFPFELVAGENTTPEFIYATAPGEPEVNSYHYTYTATAVCTITIDDSAADVYVLTVNESGTIVGEAMYEGPITLEAGEVLLISVLNPSRPLSAEGVTFTVSIA